MKTKIINIATVSTWSPEKNELINYNFSEESIKNFYDLDLK